jgi:hypothetical protein
LVIREASRGVPGLASTALALAVLASPAGSTGDGDGSAVAFDRFMRASRPICLEQPAEHCIALAWRFADADGDQGLSVLELAAIRSAFEQWTGRSWDDLSQPERSGIALGFLIVDSIGLERLHAIYDTDRDGLISRSELLADVRLDQRPLGQVLLDPAAVDHRAVARRLGVPPAMLDHALPR